MQSIPQPDLGLNADWWRSYRRRRAIGKLVASTPLLLPLLTFANAVLQRVARLYRLVNTVKREGEIERGIRRGFSAKTSNPVAFASGYGYANESEDFRAADDYRLDIAQPNSKSRDLFEHCITELGGLIAANNIKRVVNFGACYGWMDAQLAGQFPNTRFFGVDRAPAVKTLNDQSFRADNLEFVAADIVEWIRAQGDLSDAIFVHVRTAVVLPESFVRQLYRELSDRRCAFVFGAETYGIPRSTDVVYVMDLADKPSVHYREQMFIHNYPGLLAASRYETDRFEWLTLPSREDGQRIASFTAKRLPNL